jgi:hypothetical protein
VREQDQVSVRVVGDFGRVRGTILDAVWIKDRASAGRIARRALSERVPIREAARTLQIKITEHSIAVRNAARAAERLDLLFEAMHQSGALSFFHKEYQRRRQEATRQGRRFMSYKTAKRRLKGALVRHAIHRAMGAVVATDIVREALNG